MTDARGENTLAINNKNYRIRCLKKEEKMIQRLKHGRAWLIVFGIMIGFVSAQAKADTVPESDDPIKIALNEWTGQHVSAHIFGSILKEMGYQVEYVTAGAIPQITAISKGSLHVQPEIWTNLVGEGYFKALESGEIQEVGLLGLNNKEGWIYPKFMEEMCPGLPALDALVQCSESFATGMTYPKGRVITYPADWGTRSAEMIEALDLPFEPVPGGSEGAMVAELKAAQIKKRPLVMMFWTPHWVLAEIEVGWIDITPAYDPLCLSDPSWGPNPDSVADCDFEQANVTKTVWSGMKDKWPAAFELLERYELSGDEQTIMMLAIDQQGEELESVVADWIQANEERWRSWIGAAVGS